MAKTQPLAPALLFNGQPISAAEARQKLAEIYGEKRADEIPGQLADGTHGCASVAGGHLTLAKTKPE